MAERKKNDMKPAERRRILGRAVRAVGRHTPWLILSLIFAAGSALFTLYIPILAGRAIDAATGAGEVDLAIIKTNLISILICACAAAVLHWLMSVINNRVVYAVLRDTRYRAFVKLTTLPLSYLDNHRTGELISRIITDSDGFADGLLLGLSQLLTGVVTILGTLVFMLTIHPGITAVVVLLTPVSLFVAKFIAGRTYKYFRSQSELRGKQTALVNESIKNSRLTVAFGREEAMLERFDESNRRLRGVSLKAIFFSSLTNPTTRFVNSLVYASVALCGALTAVGGGITVGALASFLAYANQYTKPFNEISGVVAELQGALACAGRVFDLLDQAEEPSDADGACLEYPTAGAIRLDNVSFSYVPERPLIEGLTLNVSPGQRIAIVGPTGCGKTTLINLLMRFYDVNGGSVSVDGQDIRSLTRQSLRRNFGMVLQETWLAEGTIRDNIAMGKPDATDSEIETAARASHAHGFISRLPQGYDTPIGEDGGSLSEGQRQLLCIARVMLRQPPVLILDEATSSIDTRTELKVQDAFGRLMKGRTSFIVAHRLSTIRDADVILVMRDGHIVESGNHDRLLAAGGEYAKLYHSQFEAAENDR
ncbi:MAG: ABC transporter ATP-binding protein [Eubacteriales bacterium]|nr:ABC transporter ATP-binding protein [Eubacteriales bacterium]